MQVVVPVDGAGGSPTLMSPHTPGSRGQLRSNFGLLSPGSEGQSGRPQSPAGAKKHTHRKNNSVLSISSAAEILGDINSNDDTADLKSPGHKASSAGDKEMILDCGRKGEEPDLSWSKALDEINLNHPRLFKDEVFKKHTYCGTSTGLHNPIPFCPNPKSDLEKYGIGIVLYFKFIKVYKPFLHTCSKFH